MREGRVLERDVPSALAESGREYPQIIDSHSKECVLSCSCCVNAQSMRRLTVLLPAFAPHPQGAVVDATHVQPGDPRCRALPRLRR